MGEDIVASNRDVSEGSPLQISKSNMEEQQKLQLPTFEQTKTQRQAQLSDNKLASPARPFISGGVTRNDKCCSFNERMVCFSVQITIYQASWATRGCEPGPEISMSKAVDASEACFCDSAQTRSNDRDTSQKCLGQRTKNRQ